MLQTRWLTLVMVRVEHASKLQERDDRYKRPDQHWKIEGRLFHGINLCLAPSARLPLELADPRGIA